MHLSNGITTSWRAWASQHWSWCHGSRSGSGRSSSSHSPSSTRAVCASLSSEGSDRTRVSFSACRLTDVVVVSRFVGPSLMIHTVRGGPSPSRTTTG